MKKASGLVTKGFLAALMAGVSTPASLASISPDGETNISKTFDNNANGAYQTADIGNHYDDLTSFYPNNRAIQSIDDQFLGLLKELWDSEEDYLIENGTTPEFPKQDLGGQFSIDALSGDFIDMYWDYADGLKGISGWPDNEPSGFKRVEICESIRAQEFFEIYLKKFSSYAKSTYDLSDVFKQELQSIQSNINELRQINDKELKRLADNKAHIRCNALISKTAVSPTPFG